MSFEISKEAAKSLLNSDANVAVLSHWFGNGFLLRVKYNPDLVQAVRQIPSAKWIPQERAYLINLFDFPAFFDLARSFALDVRFEEGSIAKVSELKSNLKFLSDEAKSKQVLEPEGIKIKMRGYQILGSQFMYYAKRCLNADAPGSGKTIQSIAAVVLNKNAGNGHKTLVVVPNSVKWNWKAEVDKTCDLKAIVLDSNGIKRHRQYEEDMGNSDMYIMSYDSFMADWEELISFFHPNILILDEAHRLSNRSNRITKIMIGGKGLRKSFLTACQTIHSIYLLTGTPIVNKIEDLYPLIKIIDPTMYNVIGFRERYMKVKECKKNINGKIIKFPLILGYKNTDEIKKRLKPFMIRRTKDEIISELPKVTIKTLEIELSKEEREYYDKLKQDYKNSFRASSLLGNKITPEILNWFMKAQLICDSMELVEESNIKKSSKLEELIKTVNDNIEENKVVIFTKFRKMLHIIERELAKYKPLIIHGDVKDIDRQKAIDEFRNNPERKLFISTLAAGGVGINLTVGDKNDITMILYDRWYSAALNNQAISRSFRMGQERPIEVIILRCKDTIEEHIEKIWANKELISSDLINDDEVFKKLSYEQIINLI